MLSFYCRKYTKTQSNKCYILAVHGKNVFSSISPDFRGRFFFVFLITRMERQIRMRKRWNNCYTILVQHFLTWPFFWTTRSTTSSGNSASCIYGVLCAQKYFLAALSSSRSLVVNWTVGLSVGLRGLWTSGIYRSSRMMVRSGQ